MTLTLRAARAAHPLASIVLRQLGGGKDAVQSAIDAGEHGADAGWGGFTWYTDTVPWAQRHRAAILACASDMARDLGEGSVAQLVASFRCVKACTTSADEVEAVLFGTSRDDDAATVVWNALAWFALEEVGRALADRRDGGCA